MILIFQKLISKSYKSDLWWTWSTYTQTIGSYNSCGFAPEIPSLQRNTTLISQFPIGNNKRSRQWKQPPPHAWFSLAVTTGWDIQPLHQIHHSAEYHRSAGAAWRLCGLLVNHTDTLSQPKGGQSLSQPTNPKTEPRYIHHPLCCLYVKQQ